MRRRPRIDLVYYIAEYEDGSEGYFGLDRTILQNGDHVVIAIAEEKQRDGSLRPGKIVRVYTPAPLTFDVVKQAAGA